jgi:hypothetical protein
MMMSSSPFSIAAPVEPIARVTVSVSVATESTRNCSPVRLFRTLSHCWKYVPCPAVTATVVAPEVAPPDCEAKRGLLASSSQLNFVATVLRLSAFREKTASG